mgnify:CR=1 FL=1
MTAKPNLRYDAAMNEEREERKDRRPSLDIFQAAAIVKEVVEVWERMAGARQRYEQLRQEFVEAVESAAAKGVRKSDVARAIGLSRSALNDYLTRRRS